MRKVLSLVLVLALVLGSFAFTFAATPSDVVGEDSEDAVNVLMELGVISGYPDGSFKPAGIVTRGEMAKIIICALGLEDYAAGRSSFSDMAGHWSDKYVAYAVSLGIINGYPDNTFKADNTVSYDEAAKMLVAALGYTEDSLVGTWPANWVTKAKVLGILDGISAGSAGANRGDIAIMTYQTLDQSIGKTDKDGVWNPTLIKAGPPAEYDVMLDRLGAVLYAPTGAGSEGDAFVLTDTHADDAVANVKEFVGAYVTAYANSDDEIIAIKEVKSVFLTGEFDAAMGANGWTAGDVFEGTDKDYDLIGDSLNNAPTAATAVAPVEFVNGVQLAIPGGIVAGNEYKIAADVSGVKIKEVYSVTEWTVDDDFLFEDGDLEDDNIAGNNFKLDDNDEIDLGAFALFGVDSLEDIEEDNVVYIYSDATPEITRIEVGTEVVKGEVTKISSTGSKVTVGGKTYELAAASGDGADFAALDIEDEVEFYLDYAGDVYEVEIVAAEGDNYAILLETADGTAGLGGKDGLVKFFLADGTAKTFTVDDDLVVTGVIAANGIWNASYKDGADVDLVNDGAGTLFEYGVDEDGVIDYLAVVTPLVGPTAATTELTSKGYYDGKIVASDAIMFTYDVTLGTDAGDEDCYGVTTLAKSKGKEFAAEYYVDNSKITLMVIVGLGVADEDIYGVVTSRAKTSASGTDYQVTMLIDGEEVVYDIISTEYAKFPATYDYFTVYKLTLNTNNEITKLTAAAGAEVVLGGWTAATAFSGGVVTAGTGYTIDADAVAYALNDDGDAFEKSSVSKSNLVGNNIKLYDIDEDLVADIVLIQ